MEIGRSKVGYNFEKAREQLIKNFVFIQPHLKFGGAESQTLKILNTLAEQGHRCTLILHKREGGLLPRLNKRIRVLDLGYSSHKSMWLGIPKLRKLLKQLPPSLVVTRLWSSVLLVALASQGTHHHLYRFYEDLDPTSHSKFISAGGIKKKLIRHIYRKKQVQLIANTEHVSEAMTDVYGLNIKPKVIECGVDSVECRELARQPNELPAKDKLRLVSVGSLVPRKGYMELFEMLKGLPFHMEWVLVGEGPLETDLKALPETENLRILMAGSTENPYSLIASSDILIHGALSESFGVVLLEALALGKPVVSYAANGPKEIANSLPNAPVFLFDFRNPETFLESIDQARFFREQEKPVDLGPYALNSVISKWIGESNQPIEI